MDAEVQRPPATKRGDTKKLYSTPLPIFLHRLPPSLLTYIAGFALPTLTSKPEGVYDELTGTVWVKEERDMNVLWRRGFFGKGSLSRSEPTWLARELVRRGLSTKLSAEDYTAQRRQERRLAKIQKAKERLAERLGTPLPSETGSMVSVDVSEKPVVELPSEVFDDEPVQQMEHLQLQREEAFFLLFALDSLAIRDEETSRVLTKDVAWALFLRPVFAPLDSLDHLRPDNAFLTSYVVYHHFRSLGWVVRNGIKFCTDWVLYRGADGAGRTNAGPVGGHAEFACLVMLHYEDEADMTEEQKVIQAQRRDWRWVNTVNRVCSGVKKTLVMVYVTVPSLKRCPPSLIQQGPEAVLPLFSVREVILRRFVAARLRDGSSTAGRFQLAI